jgi:formamidopyrimidine-DNA glycosylase
MPELPEVETIKNELAPHILGRTFNDITLLWNSIVKTPSVEEFRSRLTGQKITGLSRHGKYLVLALNTDDLLVIHMKMSGSLLLSRDSKEPPKYTRAIFHLDDGTRIFFLDPRKFGRVWLVRDWRMAAQKLGPEPLEPEFTPQVLADRLRNRKAPVKALLHDQSVIAGIGNMYADEALFAARIHPLRPGGSLTTEELERLHNAIQQTLRAAIDNKGASIVNYYRPGGETGTAHFDFKVAHGRSKNCPNCGGPIQRIPVRNRGTYFCPRCQPAA